MIVLSEGLPDGRILPGSLSPATIGSRVVDRPAQADLLIAVRKGRLVSVGGGVRTGVPGGLSGIGGGVQVSSPDDMVEVFDAKDGSLIWRVMKPNGLSGAGPPLFDEFRAEVAKADKATKP